jgi:NAD(P)-dependent dehydrogenase (short-subunit alcohol dehydrogenase family)
MVSVADRRRQFDIDVVGRPAVTQVELPRLRGYRRRIVFMSSVSGRVPQPMIGSHCASTFAREAAAVAIESQAKWGSA